MSVCIHVSGHATTNKQRPIQDRVSREARRARANPILTSPDPSECSNDRERTGYRCNSRLLPLSFVFSNSPLSYPIHPVTPFQPRAKNYCVFDRVKFNRARAVIANPARYIRNYLVHGERVISVIRARLPRHGNRNRTLIEF